MNNKPTFDDRNKNIVLSLVILNVYVAGQFLLFWTIYISKQDVDVFIQTSKDTLVFYFLFRFGEFSQLERKSEVFLKTSYIYLKR